MAHVRAIAFHSGPAEDVALLSYSLLNLCPAIVRRVGGRTVCLDPCIDWLRVLKPSLLFHRIDVTGPSL